MAKQTIERMEKALRHTRREKPKIEVLWRVFDHDTGQTLVKTPEGWIEEQAFWQLYAPALREQGRVIELNWLDQNKKS